FLKSITTIFLSQIGIIIILFFVGPSRNISLIDSISNYLLKGSTKKRIIIIPIWLKKIVVMLFKNQCSYQTSFILFKSNSPTFFNSLLKIIIHNKI
ncbi:hypothetical protein ACT453_17520, partial [Bacillus sp. D-CC]